MFIKTQPRSAWGTLWGFLRTLAFGTLVMSAILGAIGLTLVSLAAFAMWDLTPYGRIDWIDVRLVVAVGFLLGLWFTLSKEGRSEWLDD